MPSGSSTCWASVFSGTGSRSTRQDAPRRLSHHRPEGHAIRIRAAPRSTSSASPTYGPSRRREERGVASDGQKPLRAGAGGSERVVPTQSASELARPACPSVPDDARPLCLLRHIGQLSTHTMVRVSGRGGVEEMVVATGSPGRVPMEPSQCNPQAPSSTASPDRPSPVRRREQSSPVRNRMREIGTSGICEGWGWQHPHLLGSRGVAVGRDVRQTTPARRGGRDC